MINIDLQRRKYDVVISNLDLCTNTFTGSIDKLTRMGCLFFTIIHDRDDTRPHIHLVIVFEKNLRAKTALNRLADVYGCPLQNIQIEECTNLAASVQYLVHKNDVNKYQYGLSSVYTNDQNYLESLYSTEFHNELLTFELLYNYIIEKNYNRTKVMSLVGISQYNYYYKVINDLYKYGEKLNG